MTFSILFNTNPHKKGRKKTLRPSFLNFFTLRENLKF